MRHPQRTTVLGLVVMLIGHVTWAQPATPAPPTQLPHGAPSAVACEAVLKAFLQHLAIGDGAGAAPYVHSTRRQSSWAQVFTARSPSEMARRVASFCAVEPSTLLSRADEVVYPLRCEQGEHRAEWQIGLRRDTDERWRLSSGLALIVMSLGMDQRQVPLGLPEWKRIGPPFAEVEAAWRGFNERLLQGDVRGALEYVDLQTRALATQRTKDLDMEEVRKMTFCEVEFDPFPTGSYVPGSSADRVVYPVHCQHGGETADLQVQMHRDVDGAWRLVP